MTAPLMLLGTLSWFGLVERVTRIELALSAFPVLLVAACASVADHMAEECRTSIAGGHRGSADSAAMVCSAQRRLAR